MGDDPGWSDMSADPTDWRHVDLDLSAYNGQHVLIRFRLQSDSLLEFDGWYVDNVQVTGCGTTAVTPGGGETALTFAARPAPNPVTADAAVFQYVIGRDVASAGAVPVSFTLHDMLGRRIRTLADASQGVGRYYLKWNATDERGVRVAPGIYYGRFRAGKRAQTVKVAVLR